MLARRVLLIHFSTATTVGQIILGMGGKCWWGNQCEARCKAHTHTSTRKLFGVGIESITQINGI